MTDLSRLPVRALRVVIVIALTVVPVYLAQRLSRESGILRRE